jgi:hypothetical protein
MTSTTFLQFSQFIIALIGLITSIVWYVVEKRRVRYISVMWGMWCFLMVTYRVYRFTLGTVTTEQALFINSLINFILLLGAVSVATINISHIIGAKKHG